MVWAYAQWRNDTWCCLVPAFSVCHRSKTYVGQRQGEVNQAAGTSEGGWQTLTNLRWTRREGAAA